MSHIYQPVMLLKLLSSGGQASISQIAKALQAHWHDGIGGDVNSRRDDMDQFDEWVNSMAAYTPED